MQKVEAYRASDGALFPTPEQCQEHELSLLWQARMDEFIDSDLCPYTRNTAQAGMMVKVILAWETFKEKHKASTAPAAAIDVDMGPVTDVPVKRKARKRL